MKKYVLTILTPILTGFMFFAGAAKVDTLLTRSEVMNRDIKASVVLPDNYDGTKEYPTVYVLHGFGGNYKVWLSSAPSFKALADTYQMILVCPDGQNSWYWDSPINSGSQYETYVSKELVNSVDQTYKTVKDRKGRAITGLSMGGHGALYLAFRHQDIFGAAGSMSGGVDIRPFPNNWHMSKQLGEYARNQKLWEDNTVINMTGLLNPDSLKLIIDCGISDFFYQVNVDLHNKLIQEGIPHDFIVRPGAHDWKYWDNAVCYQLLFMHLFFIG